MNGSIREGMPAISSSEKEKYDANHAMPFSRAEECLPLSLEKLSLMFAEKRA